MVFVIFELKILVRFTRHLFLFYTANLYCIESYQKVVSLRSELRNFVFDTGACNRNTSRPC